jgi:hypothetical protein
VSRKPVRADHPTVAVGILSAEGPPDVQATSAGKMPAATVSQHPETERGVARSNQAGLANKRRQDAEAPFAWSERRQDAGASVRRDGTGDPSRATSTGRMPAATVWA